MNNHEGTKYAIIDRPPKDIYDRAVKEFGVNFNKGVVFAYKPFIHSKNRHIESHLIHHELVHFKQQDAVGGPKNWWDIYFNDPKQRFEWEVEAYQEQYKYIVKNYAEKWHAKLLSEMAFFFTTLYDIDISIEEAIKKITG